MHRAAGRPVAIGDTAIHAARRLLLHFLIRHRNGEFAEVADAVGSRLVLHDLPVDFQKSSDLTHNIVLNS